MTFSDWWVQQGYEAAEGSTLYEMSKEGWEAGHKQAAAEILIFIVGQGTIECGKETPYFVDHNDIVELMDKFGLEI